MIQRLRLVRGERVHTHTHTDIHARVLTHTHTLTYTHTYLYAVLNTRTQVHTHLYVDLHTRTHAHIYTQLRHDSLVDPFLRSSLAPLLLLSRRPCISRRPAPSAMIQKWAGEGQRRGVNQAVVEGMRTRKFFSRAELCARCSISVRGAFNHTRDLSSALETSI